MSDTYLIVDQHKSDSSDCDPIHFGDYRCDFEVDFCKFTQPWYNDFDWQRHSGPTPTSGTGPQVDHTYGNVTGFYIYTEANGRVGKYSLLESASIPAATMGTVCVYFWYHMYGSDMGTLNVRSRVDGDLLQVFWTRSNSLDDNWYQGQAEYTSTEDFQIVFQGVIGDNYWSDMALDDISIVAEPCRALHQCDFEQENLCGYTQDQSDDFDWTWNSGDTTSDYTGPSFDVTTGTTSGHYVYIEASDHNAGDVARLTTPELDPSGGNEVTCWSFYYHMFGDNIGDMNVYIDKELDQSLWSFGGRNLGDRWFYAEVNVSRYENYSLTFEGVVGDGPQGDLAIDEVDYRLGFCQGAGSCDFENGLCSWMNIGGDEFDWSRHRGSTSTGTTGPNVDHTTGTSSGHYMYTEETGKAIGERAILYLDEPLSSGQQCLRFWYHMLGVGHGELIVFASNTSSLMMDDHYVWSLAGAQSPDQDTWLLGQVPVNFDLTNAVYFVGIIGSGSSDTALDDISFQSGHCDVVPSEAAPGSDVLPLSCDFDADRCFWRESLDDDFDWTRQTGPTISAGTGPDTDHSGTGYYLYTEASNNSPGENARLSSSRQSQANLTDMCFQFFYHMKGNSMGTLNVWVMGGNGEGVVVWTQGGSDLGNQWQEANINISPDQESYRIVFEGILGDTYQTDMAIDDISVFEGFCPLTSDYRCDFEVDFCKFTQPWYNDFDWQRRSGPTPTSGTGPQVDHTYGNVTGFYIYTEANGRVGKYSLLESASIPAATMGTVCVYFWYHMYGSDMGTLNVRSRVDGDLLQVFWTRSNSLDDNWYQGQAEYTSTEDFKIVFQGGIGDNYRSDMALDDISIVAEPCRALHQCDFEQENLCGYTQDQSDDFDWTWNSGDTTSDYTGPSFDVTMGTTSGHYVYIEASDHNAGDVARLTTPEFDPSGGNEVTCWSFYYHMFGDDIGNLNVYIDKELDQSLWSLGGRNLGDRWFYAEVNVSRYKNYSLTFESVVGDGPQGDLAIDEVDYRLGYCQGAGSCDFENGLCSWMNIGGDEFDWSRHRGSTSTGTTGPNVDHTTGTSSGHYIYTEETGKATGERAILYLDEPLSSGQQCLRFWYHMLGVGHGELIVFASNTSSLMMDDHYVWSLAGPQNPDQDTWLLGQVPVNFDLTYAVYFVGIIGSGSSDTALDDISFQSGHCDVVPSEAAPGSDVLPLSCDFDADRCFWRESLDDDFNWIRQTGPTISAGTGPDTDHSGTGEYEGEDLL
ncbi:MAM and LDL-receptor class A domain-containing protein 1-like [Diadema setosum]|uniref:MAM and LDL-receptor class A domain-containing protein 1-like n=1 Tax=Diadema setosum TaxID=31175 RepID=UPI003B3AF474